MIPANFPASDGRYSSQQKSKCASDRVSKTGNASLPKETASRKNFKAKVCASFSKFFKIIRDLFQHLFCCGMCDKEKSLSLSEPSSSSFTSDKTENNAKPVKPTTTATKAKENPALTLQKRVEARVEAEKELAQFAFELDQYRKANPKEPCTTPRSQKNLGQTCYMNAALQCLDATHGLYHQRCIDLVDSSLVLKTEKTLQEFEKEVLSIWSPIEVNLDRLLKTQETLFNQLAHLERKEGENYIRLQGNLKNVERKIADAQLQNQHDLLQQKVEQLSTLDKEADEFTLNKEILDLKLKVLEKEDRILFKWSYLLLLQAKRYGTDEHITKALEYHHNVCFTIARGDLKDKPGHYGDKITNPKSTRKVPHDTASYFDLWHDMLGRQLDATRYKEFTHEGKEYVDHISVDPLGVVLLHTTGKNDDFMSCLRNFFDSPERNDDGCIVTVKNEKIKIHDYFDHCRFNQDPPNFITFSLKRINFLDKKRITNAHKIPFARDSKTGKAKKSYKKILNLKDYFGTKVANYKLIGCTLHMGQDGVGGHYIAYVLGKDKIWYKCDDSTIKPVSYFDIHFSKARTLTYAKALK